MSVPIRAAMSSVGFLVMTGHKGSPWYQNVSRASCGASANCTGIVISGLVLKYVLMCSVDSICYDKLHQAAANSIGCINGSTEQIDFSPREFYPRSECSHSRLQKQQIPATM